VPRRLRIVFGMEVEFLCGIFYLHRATRRIILEVFDHLMFDHLAFDHLVFEHPRNSLQAGWLCLQLAFSFCITPS
jgi:hypothetical protein